MFRKFQILFTAITMASLVISLFFIGHEGAGAAGLSRIGDQLMSETAETSATADAPKPLLFETNKGQTDTEAKFIVRGNGYIAYLAKQEARFQLQVPVSGEQIEGGKDNRSAPVQSEFLKMHFVGANENPTLEGRDEAITKTNYFIGQKRFTNLSNFGRVNYTGLYKGIDATFYGNQDNQLEYDFVVAPNADAGQIALNFDGAKDLAIDEAGNLTARTANAELVQQRPFAYHEIDGQRLEIASRYVIREDNSVGFELGEYDRSRTLVIDPALNYLTYIGGTGFDDAFEVTADAQGNSYISGQTDSLNFHGQPRNDNDSEGAYVAKINPQGTAFVYVTILEGNDSDSARGIALDASNNLYVTGTASHFFPTTSGAYDTTHGTLNDDDVFIAKLNTAGDLVYSSFLGGADEDEGFDVAVDAGGKAYVTGFTFSNIAFPTKNKYQGCGFVFPTSLDSQDAFLTVMNASGSDITYSTCIGGRVTHDQGFSIALDASNNAYLTGIANGGNFPTKNAFQSESGGGTDAWVAKFNPSASGEASLIYSTYLGGAGTDQGNGVAVDSSGQAHIAGLTGSVDFPLKNAFRSTNQVNEGFVTVLNAAGTDLVNSTFLGGSDQDKAFNIALGVGGAIYVTGKTSSPNFPTSLPFQATKGTGFDAFVTKLKFPQGIITSSFLGGNGSETGEGIFARGNFIYVAGGTSSTNLATTAGVIKTATNNADGFTAKILEVKKDTIGTYDPVATFFKLKNSLAGGAQDIGVNRGLTGDVPVTGDFNGDGIDTASTFNNGLWKIRNSNSTLLDGVLPPVTVSFGAPGDLPIVGDWNGDGIDTPGVYRPSAGQFHITNSLAVNPPDDFVMSFGVGEDLPVAGDWNADGVDSIGVFRPSVGSFFLADQNIGSPQLDHVANFGTNGDLPVAGDWNGDGIDTIGVWRTSTAEFFLTNDLVLISNQFVFGVVGEVPLAGDWDGKP